MSLQISNNRAELKKENSIETPEMRLVMAVDRHRKIDCIIIPNMVGRRSYLASCEI
jgi:hypothetical protein